MGRCKYGRVHTHASSSDVCSEAMNPNGPPPRWVSDLEPNMHDCIHEILL